MITIWVMSFGGYGGVYCIVFSVSGYYSTVMKHCWALGL